MRRPLGVLIGIDQQSEFVATQPGDLVAGLELVLHPPHDLQNQSVTGLITQSVIGAAKVVQVQMPERQMVATGKTCGQHGLKPLPVGDPGQRVLPGQTLEVFFKTAALTNMPQAATKGVIRQRIAHQPVIDAGRPHQRLLVEQHHHRQGATAGRRLQAGGGE